MMKKLLLFSFSISLFSMLNAQEYEYVPFPTSNAIWSQIYNYYGSHSFYPNDTMNVKYALFDEDTTIFEKTYHKLFMVFDSIPSRQNAILTLYISDITGRVVKQFINHKKLKGGKYFYKWQPQINMPSGIYTVRLLVNNISNTNKIIKN